MDNFNYLYDNNIPLVRHNHKAKTRHTSKTPWITHSLLKSVSKKNKLCRQYLANPTIAQKNKYTKYKNILTNLLRSSKKNVLCSPV